MTGIARAMAALVVTGSALLAAAAGSDPHPPRDRTPRVLRGAGARLPIDEYEAEDGRWTGTPIGPDDRPGTLASEASGRRAVLLRAPGDRVTVRLRHAANALTIRAAIPDSPDGHGLTASLTLLAAGRWLGRPSVTSRYGWFYGRYPFTNDPRDGHPHHFYDETRILLPRRLPAGTLIDLRHPAEAGIPWVAIDLVDAELVPPPRAPPRGSLSILSFGGDPSGQRSSADALDRTIEAARAAGVAVWLPPGTFRIDRHVIVDRVRILGAGPWYSVLRGHGVGLYGKPAFPMSTGVELGGFAIEGDVDHRRDDEQSNGIGGAIGGGSFLHDLFIHHVKAGLWFDGPFAGLRIRRLRVTDTTADGLNFHRGVAHASVEDSLFRNTGDDGLAAWSEGLADHHIRFVHDTVILPMLANGIAFYGGHDLVAADDFVADIVTEGGGLQLGNRFDAVPASGRIDFSRDVLLRARGWDLQDRSGSGALWFYALDHPIEAAIRADRIAFLDSGGTPIGLKGLPIATIKIADLTISSTFQTDPSGQARTTAGGAVER